jgi:ribulose-phosphate 3-epimerase
MTEIAPCITVEDEATYKEYAEKIFPFAKRVHIDTSDGIFTPTLLTAPDRLWWPPEWMVDVHAMVEKPSQYVQTLVSMKPNLIIFHAEVEEDLLPIMQYVKQNEVKVGIALQRSTVPSSVASLIEAADHVMIFSGTLGRYGGTASMIQLHKVGLIRAINQTVEIGWDGGVNLDNAFTLSKSGIDVLNVGGAIATSDDPAAAYAKLVEEINKQGVI